MGNPSIALTASEAESAVGAVGPGAVDPGDWCVRLAGALVAHNEPRTALQALCETVRELTGCDRVQIWRGDLRQMSIFTLIAAGYSPEEEERLHQLLVPMRETPVANERFITEKVSLVHRAKTVTPFAWPIFEQFGIESAMFVLLERGPRIIGALQMSWCDADRVRVPDRAAIEVIRTMAALGVDFVARTDDATGLSQNLSETATLLARMHDPDELLGALAAKVAEAVGCDWAAVHLMDEGSSEMRRVAVHGVPAPPDDQPASGEILAWVEQCIAESDDGVLEIPDVRKVPEIAEYVADVPISSYFAVPLVEDGKLVGLMTLGYLERTGRFARRQISLAKGLAKHALVALRNARLVRSLQEANQVKADFIAAVSHDLRTPLHVLIGYNAMLLEGAAGPLSEEQRQLVARMYDCSVHFLDLINGVLNVGRVEAGFDHVVLSDVKLNELCAEIVHEVEYLRKPDVELCCDAPAVTVRSDSGKLATILRNLVTNALKFTTSGLVAVEVEVRDGQIVMRVRDTGPGIPPEERPKVFEMFRQGSAGLRAGGSGLGLGLYLVKRLAAMLGGTVELLSGNETVFEVRIPTEVVAPAA
ncbi:MAG TPA: GAF domain-containing sensor histidine kinase [Candidatus Binatia bacterium]